ncbi:MAG: hypothetical protein Q8K60_01270 [Parachlamydiaceae bacterium]|nr:hypothetical protein [Parachlamydiaceae bacterium]
MKIQKNFFHTSICLFGLLSLILCFSSCARQISSDVYSARQVGEISITYAGVIRSMREVVVEHGDQLGDNEAGVVAGGVTGGVLGSAIGRGNLAPTALGAVAGAIAGSLVEKKLKTQTGMEYVVELNNGGLLTIVQGNDECFQIGQPVYVLASPCGRSRITPQYY